MLIRLFLTINTGSNFSQACHDFTHTCGLTCKGDVRATNIPAVGVRDVGLVLPGVLESVFHYRIQSQYLEREMILAHSGCVVNN